MALFKNMIITSKGMALYAKAQAGQEIRFTKMQVGSGQIETQNPIILLGLLDPKLDIPITSITPNPELKSATIVGSITNKDVKEALYICELGIFAQDPDEGEILYGYVSAGGYGDYYAPESQGPYSWQYEINASIGNAANVTAELSQLQWDYGVINSNKHFLHLRGGNQNEINKSIDELFGIVAKDTKKLGNKVDNIEIERAKLIKLIKMQNEINNKISIHSKLKFTRDGIAINPLATLNYISGNTVKNNELITVNTGDIKPNMLVDLELKDNTIIENISKDRIYMEFL